MDEETIIVNDKCRLKFDEMGNVTIMGDCDGQKINRVDVSLFNRVTNDIEDDNKK